jgi:hypothetical protein
MVIGGANVDELVMGGKSVDRRREDLMALDKG